MSSSPFAISGLNVFSVFFLLVISFFGAMAGDSVPRDMGAAVELCDSSPLDPVEGVWLYPDDNVTVLVLRRESSEQSFTEYDLTVVSSSDCRLSPGDLLGRLTASADPSRFRLTLFTVRKDASLTLPGECLATLDVLKEALFVQSRKLKIRIGINTLLPRFWRIAKVSVDNPLDRLQPGMVRIYPSYDGNGSSRRKPRYL